MNINSLNTGRRKFLQLLAKGLSLAAVPNILQAHLGFETVNTWKTEPDLPIIVQEIYGTAYQGKIHIAGGLKRTSDYFGATTDHLAYNPKTQLWKFKAPLPENRHHIQMVHHKNELYALGGYFSKARGESWIIKNQTWKYDSKNNRWEDSVPATYPHGETVAASLGGCIHIVGGRQPIGSSMKSYQDYTDSDLHLQFDSQLGIWRKLAPSLTRRNSAAGAVIDGLWYVVGGRNMALDNIATLEIYDPKEDRWRTGTPMPQGQGGLAAAALGGKLYAFGGEYFKPHNGVFSACWVYNPTKDSWDKGPPMKTPRHGLAGVTLGTKIYALGGAKRAYAEETSAVVESFRPV